MIENQLEASKKSIFLGYSKKYTLYDSGCLVHCVARLLKKPVLEVHEKLKSSGCFFADSTGDVCLLDLTKVPNAYPQLKWISKETTWNQEKALAAISQAGGLIVGVDYSSSQSGIQDHFVFFHGNGELEDSLNGVVRPSNFYKVISMRIFEVVEVPVIEDKLTADQSKALEILTKYKTDFNHGNLEGAINALIGLVTENKNLSEKILTVSKDLENSQKLASELSGKLAQEVKLRSECQTQLVTANENLGKTEENLATISAEKVKSDNRYKSKNDEFNAMKTIVSNYDTLIALILLKFKGQSLDDYLSVKIPEIIKLSVK